MNHTTEKGPVNLVTLSEDGRQFIVEECILCGSSHRHGRRGATVVEGGQSPRTAHCTDRVGGSYDIKLVEEATPPEGWCE